ncbi:hypothetical protein [Tepidibacter hydrothermalis]|uniref:Uncharacterized protein n=1 Tax=Tepidibacter hydrothermalis TaxID=3036126 RepID=A0ABY8EFF1_9FIRM|nr:hypothetical protein [Tepidibacter hydrothermalis]WFD11678.1 hypothetical protein P4S50_06275 [Tepidibacter hydrothermalis]
MEENIQEMDKPKKKKRIPLMVIGVLLTTFAILYYTNTQISTMTNNIFKKVPIIGERFEQMPSLKEQEERKNKLARYYLTLDEDRAIDKLIIMEKEDKKLYEDIIMKMKKYDLSSTNGLVQKIRDKKIKKDILQREIDSIEQEKLLYTEDLSKDYKKLGLLGTIKGLEQNIIDLNLNFEDVAKIIEKFKPEYSAKVLYYMDQNISQSIKENLHQKYFKDIQNQTQLYKKYIYDMKTLADIYVNKKTEEASVQLQNKNTYSAQDLGTIFANMDYLQASKILCEFEDGEYLDEVLKEIKLFEQLNEKEESIKGITDNINNTLKVLEVYKRDLKTLKLSYEKMNSKELSDLVNEMTSSKPKYKKYKIDEEKSFTITEEDLMIEVLKQLKPKLLSEVISNLDNQKSAEISRKIGLPKQ